MNLQIGTQHWMAPELFQGNEYDEKVDIWAAGVLAYYLYSGCIYPFDSDQDLEEDHSNEEEVKEEIKQRIMNEDANFDELQIAPYVKYFIQRCLDKDPSQRWTAA